MHMEPEEGTYVGDGIYCCSASIVVGINMCRDHLFPILRRYILSFATICTRRKYVPTQTLENVGTDYLEYEGTYV